MAIRYSGDVEIRVGWDPRAKRYRGTVRDPRMRWSGSVTPGVTAPRDRRSPDAYDHAARLLARDAQAWARKSGRRFDFVTTGIGPFGRVKTDRVFQAPCPLGD